MALEFRSHNRQLCNPGFDFGFEAKQVHKFRQME